MVSSKKLNSHTKHAPANPGKRECNKASPLSVKQQQQQQHQQQSKQQDRTIEVDTAAIFSALSDVTTYPNVRDTTTDASLNSSEISTHHSDGDGDDDGDDIPSSYSLEKVGGFLVAFMLTVAMVLLSFSSVAGAVWVFATRSIVPVKFCTEGMDYFFLLLIPWLWLNHRYQQPPERHHFHHRQHHHHHHRHHHTPLLDHELPAEASQQQQHEEPKKSSETTTTISSNSNIFKNNNNKRSCKNDLLPKQKQEKEPRNGLGAGEIAAAEIASKTTHSQQEPMKTCQKNSSEPTNSPPFHWIPLVFIFSVITGWFLFSALLG